MTERVRELELLREACARLGAPVGQDRVMASQLLKRAEQLAGERSISKTEAMEYLLKLAVAGREGRDPKDILPPGDAETR